MPIGLFGDFRFDLEDYLDYFSYLIDEHDGYQPYAWDRILDEGKFKDGINQYNRLMRIGLRYFTFSVYFFKTVYDQHLDLPLADYPSTLLRHIQFAYNATSIQDLDSLVNEKYEEYKLSQGSSIEDAKQRYINFKDLYSNIKTFDFSSTFEELFGYVVISTTDTRFYRDNFEENATDFIKTLEQERNQALLTLNQNR